MRTKSAKKWVVFLHGRGLYPLYPCSDFGYGVGDTVTSDCVGAAVSAEVLIGAPIPLDSPTATQNIKAAIRANMITEAMSTIRAVGRLASITVGNEQWTAEVTTLSRQTDYK